MFAFLHMRLYTSVVFLLNASCAFSATPVITGVVNAASFAAGTLAAGSLGTIFGSDLAATTAVAGIPLPASLGSASVYVNDIAVPLLYVSAGQINFQVPWQAVPGPSTVLIINSNGISNYLSVQIAVTAPGLFSGGVVASAWGEPTRAVHAGEYVTIYATGLGPVENPPPTGMSLPDAALATVRTTPTVTIGGMPATVAFAGLAPPGQNRYTVGVYQIDALVPSSAPAGDSVPVVVSTAGIGSNPVTVSIAAGASPSIAKYIELGPAGAVVARAITSENVCPLISIDGTSQPMQMRAAASLPFYPVLSCETAIPSGTKAVAIDGQALTLPINNPQRITVLGDTGCRMDMSNSQACSDPKAWPVATVAASALSTNPQLLIHNGDYHYREAQCSPSVPGCAGSPWGYNWDVWREDVFRPLQSLLPAAPWVFVRGNHESCDRAGEGWFRFLDPRPLPTACQIYTDPYAVSLGNLQIIHLDSAAADDAVRYPDQIATYQQQFGIVQRLAGSNAWIVTHRPLWGIRSNMNANVVLQAASQNTLPAGVQMVLSGHTHVFQTFNFSPARAPQLIIGNGGDNLASVPTVTPSAGAVVGNAAVADTTIVGGFGFSTMTPNADGSWTVISRDVNGAPNATCTLQPNQISCNK